MSALDALLLHAAATWGLFGLIWTVQLVQYPGFARVGPREFAGFHDAHCRGIAWLVGPLMGLELATGALLFVDPPAELDALSLRLGVGSLAVNWLVTGLLFVPLHGSVRAGDRVRLRRLVSWNRLRTLVWSARAVWVAFALRAAVAA